MDTKPATLLIHAGCVVTIAACITVSATLLQPYPIAALTVTGAGFWLWGTLGFKPAAPILDAIVQKLAPADVVRLISQRPAPIEEPRVTPSDIAPGVGPLPTRAPSDPPTGASER